MDEHRKAEIEKIIGDAIAAGDAEVEKATKPHRIAAGELLIEARQNFPNDDRKFWQWAIRNFGERTSDMSPGMAAQVKAACKARLQHCIDLATADMWERLQPKRDDK